MPRRYAESDFSDDRYDDRRSDYPPRSNGRGRGTDERYYEEDIEYSRTRGPPVKEREREREREEIVVRSSRAPPDFLRDDYGRTNAGPMVLRKRETEEYDFIPHPRRRSPSPEVERKVEREEIIIRRDSPSPPPRREAPPERAREREEIIIRRTPEAPPPPPIPREREREEIIIRRDEREREPSRRRDDYDHDEIVIRRDREERRPPPPREVERERDEIVIKRDDNGRRSKVEIDFEKDDDRYERRRPPPPRDYDREEIIIRRDERDRDDSDRVSRVGTRSTYDDYPPPIRPKSHERERSRAGGSGGTEDEIIIRRDEGGGRRGDRDRDREEIIIRRKEESRSPSPVSSVHAPLEPPIIRAPPIHQEVITHHRHIDHGYELALAPARVPSVRPPSPPSPPPARAKEEERIDIHRSGVRNGRAYDEDIIIDRVDRNDRPPARSVRDDSPPPPPAPRRAPRAYDDDVAEEAAYYNNRALDRSYPGEGYNGATRDWAIVDVPPGTRRVEMDGVGGGRQEITWQRYNGVRRSKFVPETGTGSDEGYGSELARPAPAPAPAASGGEIGRSYGSRRDPTAGLWTEITKDLVVREAIVDSGYEFTETEEFYYIIAYLDYDGVARLVGLSDDIKRDRRRRAEELEREARFAPEEEVMVKPPRLAIEGAPSRGGARPWEAEEERYIEREVVYRGGRPPPPVEWRRY